MKCKRLLSILLSLWFIVASFSVSFAAVNDNARLKLSAGEIIDGKYTIILVAENCLDLTACDLTISYNADVVEFLPYRSWNHGEAMRDVGAFNLIGSKNSFSSSANIVQEKGEILVAFNFLRTFNPQKYNIDTDIENAQVMRFYFNLKDNSADEIALNLSGKARFEGRAELLFDEDFNIALPCNGSHTNANFDLLCDKCGENVSPPSGFTAGFYNIGSYSYNFDGNELTLMGCCEPVENVDFPAYIYGYPVTKIDTAAIFTSETINIPETVIDIPDNIFGQEITSFNVSIDNPNFSSADGVLFNKNKTTLIKYPSSKENISYTIPESVVTIKDGAFSECKYLEELNLPAEVVLDDSECLANKIYYCSKLSKISVASGNKHLVCVDGVIYNEDKTGLLLYPLGKTDKTFVVPDGVVFIGNYAFYGNEYLEEITMNGDLKSIGVFAFGLCSSLKKVTLPEIEEISYGAFADCVAIKTVYYGGDIISWINWRQWTLENLCLLTADVICAKGNGIVKAENKEIKDYGENSILVLNDKTVEELKHGLKDVLDYPMVVHDNKGKEVSDSDKLGTGMRILIPDGNEDVLLEKTVIVPCDINGDASVSAADARLALRASVKLENLNSYQIIAANVDGATDILAADARLILRASVGLEKTSQLFNSVI